MSSKFWRDRYGWFIIGFFLAISPLVLYGTKGAFDSIQNRVEDWLPETFEETQRFLWFFEQFGTDELLMISWEGCTLDDPRLTAYQECLRSPDSRGRVWFDNVLSGIEAIESLTSEPLELPREVAIDRLQGWVIGNDRRQTCVVAVVSEIGMEDRHSALDFAYRCAEQVKGLTADDLIMAGPTRDDVAIDKASTQGLELLNLGSFTVCIAIMLVCFRSFRATLVIFLIALFCEQLSMAIMWLSGQDLDSVLTLAANLTFVLTISSGVHLLNYYRESLHERSAQESVGWAARAALVPCLLSAGTTSVGMLSLTVSQIRPVTNFGFYAALSIFAAALVLLCLAPAVLYKFPLDPPRWRERDAMPKRLAPVWDGLSRTIEQARWIIFLGSLAILAFCLVGVQRISTSAHLHDLLEDEAPILQDYNWLEEHVGPLIPIEVILRIPQDHEMPVDQRFRLIDRVQQSVAQVEGIGATMSAATFAPQLPPADRRGIRAVTRRAAARKILEGRLDEYVEMGYLRIDQEEQLWRISARVRAADRLQYGELMDRLQRAVDSAVAETPEVQPIYTGSVPLINKAQTEMLNDLIKSFGLAFTIIAVIMIVLLRNVLTGIFSMVPNSMPTLLAFGTMGWLGVQIEVGTLLTASAALGIAVDDSLHFISWFKRGLADNIPRREAIRLAYSHCGLAMTQTSLICSFGLLVFALSPFTPISQFAFLMFSLLLTALVCDLLVLPAVLLCFTWERSGKI